MQLYHITEDISRASGGVRPVVKVLQSQFYNSQILTTEKDRDDLNILSFSHKGPWLYSKDLKNYLNTIDSNTIFHLHGVWMHAQYIAAKIAIAREIPFIITPHGMFEPWLWKSGKLKKKLYLKLFTSSAFAKARYLHAITPEEKKTLQILFPKTEVICIPNAIEIEDVIDRKKPIRPYFLFLGRVHPVKGVQMLIEVFKTLKSLDFDLIIAGPESEHRNELEALAFNDKRIKFIGEIRGLKKKELYRNAHTFVAPSYSEVVGMVILEAAMMGTPVITTFQTGLLKEWGNNGGILINPTFNELKTALVEASKWNDQQRKLNGNKLRNFMIQEYSWKVNKPKWEALYNSMKKKI